MQLERSIHNNCFIAHRYKIIYINIAQMMVGKQWVESWGMYRWAVEANTY